MYNSLFVKLAVTILMSVTLIFAEPIAADSVSLDQLQKLLEDIRANQETREAAIIKGKELAGFCALCHGLDGNSTKPEIPHLAAQNSDYLLEQVERFADGSRNDFIMSPLAKRFTTGEKIALVIYYNAQKRINRFRYSNDPAALLRGSELYKSKCISCHGSDGRGKLGYSNISGMPVKYVSSTLTHFREKTGGRTNSLMMAVASPLSNDDIDVLSAFISRLH